MAATPTTRRRSLPFKGARGYYQRIRTFNPTGGSTTISQGTVASIGNLRGTQVTTSENHSVWRSRKHSRFTGDIGGNFFTQKKFIEGVIPIVDLYGLEYSVPPHTGTEGKYHGPCMPISPASMGFPPAGNSSNAELDVLGSLAISRCKPTNSIADASVFLGELLREGIPSITSSTLETWKRSSAKARSKGPAQDYLNLEFGWKPIARDIGSLTGAVFRAEQVLSQYERDAGKVVRRRYEFPTKEVSSVTTVKTSASPYVPGGSSVLFGSNINKGTVIRIRNTIQRRWFSGAFTYHLPLGYSERSMMSRTALKAKLAYGLSLDPETIWNLAPWTWAIDWVSNAGAVVSNLSDWATDGLVLKYGYIMEHTVVRDTYDFVGPTGLHSSDVRPVPITFVTETKIRRRATPFGFGLTMGGLTPRQLSIISALGISRS